jgi:uncharacterized protein
MWGKFFRRLPTPPMRTVRLETPDNDFVQLVRVDAPADHPRLLLLHGLEGTERSHYARGILDEAHRRGWGADLFLFRGCGGEMNRARRSYHSGETTDLALVIEHITREFPAAPLGLAGVSLGGNVLLKYLGERGRELSPQIRAAAAVSVPYDLERGCRRIGQGFSRVYGRNFLRTLRRKALAKLDVYPEIANANAIRAANSIYDFDDVYTAPVHGFRDAHDYYSQSSAIGWIDKIRLPTLLLSAVDDPFLPPEVLDDVRPIAARNPALEVEFVERGGHVGFIQGRVPWRPFYYAEWRVVEFLAERMGQS